MASRLYESVRIEGSQADYYYFANKYAINIKYALYFIRSLVLALKIESNTLS
jgi:hypothetical protein